MRLLIATPAYGGSVTVQYLNSLIDLLDALRERGVTWRRYNLGSAMISRVRNAYATAALEDPSITHLVFIDADMGFKPSAILRMLDFGEPYVGVLYPSRVLDFDHVHAIARRVDDKALAQSVAQQFVAASNILKNPDGSTRMVQGFARMKAIGTGLTVIRREVLERMGNAYPDLWAPAGEYRELAVRGDRVFQPFEGYRSANGFYLSEDLSFAQRWADIGGEMWALLDEPVTHVGQAKFTGAYADRFKVIAQERAKNDAG